MSQKRDTFTSKKQPERSTKSSADNLGARPKLTRETSRGQVEYVRANPGQTIDLAGQELFYREPRTRLDGASAAVFIHGLGASSTNWNELQALLAPEVFGVAVDLPGFGRSGRAIDGNYSPAAHAEVVATFIEWRFPGERVHVFGNSMGGAVALRLATNHPELVRSVTYISPALHNRLMSTNFHISLASIPVVGERLTKFAQRRPAAVRVQDMYERVYADASRLHPQRREDSIADAAERNDVAHVVEAMVGSAKGLVTELIGRSEDRALDRLSKVKVPSLFVYGRYDRLVHSAGAFRVTKAMPQARVVVFPHSGHVAQMEDPDLVAEAWQEFIYPITDARGI